MSLKHLAVPESKEVLKKTRMAACQRDKGANMNMLPVVKVGTI